MQLAHRVRTWITVQRHHPVDDFEVAHFMFRALLSKVLKWRVRTPLFPQLEISECGAACLGAILGYYGRWVSIEELRTACGVSRDGSSAADIVTAGEQYGLKITGWRRSIAGLREITLPAILFWEFNHFVVLEHIGGGKYFINDPANGRRTVNEETFNRSYTGVALVVEPTDEFRPGGTPPGIVRNIWPWLRDVKAPLAYAALCGLLLALPGLASPIILSSFVDSAIAGNLLSVGYLLVVASAIAAGLIYLLTLMRQIVLRRLSIRVSVVHSARLLTKLFRLPSQYLAHRYAGDLSTRVRLVDEVAARASGDFVGIVIDLVMSVLFLGLMVYFDPLLAALVAGLAVANLFAMRVLSNLRRDQNRQLRREQALLYGIGVFGLRNIDNLRATASDDGFFTRLTGYQARELAARQKFAELGNGIGALPKLFILLGAALVLGVGGWQVISGEMSLGNLMGFYMVAAIFLTPVGNFVQFADTFQILEADMQRINDVMTADEDPSLGVRTETAPGRIATLQGKIRLAGKIELRDVTFGFRPNHPPLIKNFNLTIEPGQRVAVIGPTGSGKSTLLRLVSGEYSPWSGEILFDGVPRNEVPRNVMTGSVATVDQQIFLFSATIRENLTLWNPTVTDHQLLAASTDALIHDEIMSRLSGYDSHVEEGGRNFSGGQRQRLEIARALINNPSVLLLDEATSTLDAITEMHIDDALRRRGSTCLIVAHRLSTIRDCDQIIVLNKGEEVQRGTHDELVENADGIYHELIHAH